jgi:ribose transport system permease protein
VSAPAAARPASGLSRTLNPARRKILFAFAAAVLVFVVGDIIEPGFASASGVKTVVEVASFVGLVAAGQTLVVLIGGIDLSVPWTLNAAAVLLAVAGAGSNGRAAWAVPLVLLAGLGIGVVNGLGVAVLAVPAVVMTLGMNGVLQGLTLGLTDGFTCANCSAAAPPGVANLVNGDLLGIPGEIWVWIVVTIAVTVLLSATTFGRRVYAVGNNDRASYLSGVDVKLVTIALYGLSGFFAALAGILLMGYGGKATLGMGDPYLFQSIAAVVIGGVYILGGRGHYLGVVAGAITLTALLSILLAKDIEDWVRNVVYGVVIIAILLLYGREPAEDG